MSTAPRLLAALGSLLVLPALSGVRGTELPALTLAAQEPPAPSAVPEALVERVREEVAARWGTRPADVALEFSRPRAGADLDTVLVALVGSGAGGHWVVRTARRDGGTESLRVRAGTVQTTPVAARRIERGERLTWADMEFGPTVRWGPPAPTASTPEEGWEAQRVIRPGEPLGPPAVQPPLAVRSGEAVEIVWRGDGVGVRTPGKAAGSGALGETVFVRTLSGVRLRGVVVAPGRVDVTRGGSPS